MRDGRVVFLVIESNPIRYGISSMKELKFYPSLTNKLFILSEEQVAQFNVRGYISPIRVFDLAEIAEH